MSCVSITSIVLVALIVVMALSAVVAYRAATWLFPISFGSVVVVALMSWMALLVSFAPPAFLVMLFDAPDAGPVCSTVADSIMLGSFYSAFLVYLGSFGFFTVRQKRSIGRARGGAA